VPRINERRGSPPAACLVRVAAPKFGISSAAFVLVNPRDHLKIVAKLTNDTRNSTMAQQQKGMEAVIARLKEQESQIQKVRAA
jgi:hypothetical protein